MIITISHQKGGVGKSTIAFNLAVLFRKKHKVKIIDLDIQKSLTCINIIRDELQKKPLNILKLNNSKELKDIILNNRKNEIYIIDCGGFDSEYNRLSIIGADLVITPISNKSLDLLGLKHYQEILQELSQIKKDTIKSHVVLNNINPQTKNFNELIKFIEKSKHFKVLKSKIKNRVDISQSLLQGLSITEYKPNSKADIEFKNLKKEINLIIKGLKDE